MADHVDQIPVYLPPAPDNEINRQLSLEIWGEVYAKECQAAANLWYEWLVSNYHPPKMEDFSDVVDWCMASELYGLKVEQEKNRILFSNPLAKANCAAIRGVRESWGTVRRLVWERDKGICRVCGYELEWGSDYECGHIIDRVVGGSDRPCNLVCMCAVCNRLKPLTRTRQEYIEWASQGGPIEQITQEAISAMLSGENENYA